MKTSDRRDGLGELALRGIKQIEEKGYDAGDVPAEAVGRMRWGIAANGKHVVAVSQRL